MTKPRDLGLLLWCLLHRIPVESQITESLIEIARKHCGMSSRRLAELRTEPYGRYWHKMQQKRDRRLAYFRSHGSLPQGWTPPAPGEQDRTYQVVRMRLYWLTRARIKARLRKRASATNAKLVNAYYATKKIRSHDRKLAALNAVESMLVDQGFGASARVSFSDYLHMRQLSSIRQEEFHRLSRGRKRPRHEPDRSVKEKKSAPGAGSAEESAEQ